jgi:hypothetical protein
MMKNPFKKILYTSLIIATGTALTAFSNGETVKLINKKTNFVVIEFNNGKATFHDRFLEPEMREAGILIPSELAAEYGGKETILLDDELFEKAFKEIYYRYYTPHSVYELVE